MADLFGPVLNHSAFRLASFVTGAICALIAVGIIIWIYRDADDRDAKPILWVSLGAVFALAGAGIGFVVPGSLGFAPVGVFMAILVGVLSMVYRVVRPLDLAEDAQEREMAMHLLKVELDTKSCTRCGGAIERDFILCPSCGTELRRPCSYCGRPNKLNWAACPYCGARKGA